MQKNSAPNNPNVINPAMMHVGNGRFARSSTYVFRIVLGRTITHINVLFIVRFKIQKILGSLCNFFFKMATMFTMFTTNPDMDNRIQKIRTVVRRSSVTQLQEKDVTSLPLPPGPAVVDKVVPTDGDDVGERVGHGCRGGCRWL
jgi:hypothetical protein